MQELIFMSTEYQERVSRLLTQDTAVKKKAKLKEKPSSGSCITSKILNSLLALGIYYTFKHAQNTSSSVNTKVQNEHISV